MAKRKNEIVDGMKKCNICNELKSVDEFYPYKGTIRGACKKCQCKKSNDLRKKWSKERKHEAYKKSLLNPNRKKNQYKNAKKRKLEQKIKAVEYLGGRCSICGYNKCLQALEFHHKDPTTKEKLTNNAAVNRAASFENIKSELDKCVLLCANCHREVHYHE